MIRNISAPYVLPREECVEMSPWSVQWNGSVAPLGSVLDGWASGDDVTISRIVRLDLDEIRMECGISADATLGLSVSWISDSTKIRQRIYLNRSLSNRNEIEVVLPGDRIGGTVEISTSLIVVASPVMKEKWIAQLPGSILAKDVNKVTLEGEGSMFPMAVVDFDGRVYDSSASWFVETSTDLEANFSATFQVMVNEKDKALVRAIEESKPSKDQICILDNMQSGVMQVVLELAYTLKHRGDLLDFEYGDGTVGETLWNLIEQTGNRNLDDMTDPSQIATRSAVFQGMARDLSAGRVF